MEIDHEIISTVILLPSTDSFKKGCCQLQAKVCARITGYPLVQACPGKSVFRWTDCPAMTIAVDLGHKVTKQTNLSAEVGCCIKMFTPTINFGIQTNSEDPEEQSDLGPHCLLQKRF